jgi:hypothetical protein
VDSFVRQLVLRLFDSGKPLSRNRHFHTFDTPEGKRALKLFKRLRAVSADIKQCHREGGQSSVRLTREQSGHLVLEMRLSQLRGVRFTRLDDDEFRLLCQVTDVRQLLSPTHQAL